VANARWEDVTRQILDALDIRQEYHLFGIQTQGRPNRKGWDQVEGDSSAYINIGRGPLRGRYKDFGGDGFRGSLFDAAAHFGNYADWKEARRHYAHKAGVSLPRGQKAPVRLDDKIDFGPWNEMLARAWTLKKPGTTVRGMELAGCQMAAWPKKTREFKVFAIPVWGVGLMDADPVAYVIWQRSGQDLQIFQGKDIPRLPAKSATIKPKDSSPKGWIGTHGIAHLEEAEIVWKVEGVTDLIALQSIIPEQYADRHIVLTNVAGTNEDPEDDLVELLSGKRVFVLHDMDRPGQGEVEDWDFLHGAKRWCQAIEQHAAECRNVQLPFDIVENHGPDVRDWIQQGGTYEQLLELADAADRSWNESSDERVRGDDDVADGRRDDSDEDDPSQGEPDYQSDDERSSGGSGEEGRPGSGENESEGDGPSSPPPDSPGVGGTDDDDRNADLFQERMICRALQIDVMGELSGGRVKVFSMFHRKSEIIHNVPRMTFSDFLRICGPPAKAHLIQSVEGATIAGRYQVSQARDAISLLAGYERIDQKEKGVGIWSGVDDFGDRTDTVVLVGAGDAARLNGEAMLRRLRSPRSDGLMLDLSSTTPWFRYETLREYVQLARDHDWANEVVTQASAFFREWNWKHEYMPDIVTALVMATWVQTAWAWRPLIAVIGATSTGKSLLFDSLKMIFGNLAIKSDQSTEAGIRQVIANSARVILCDEFEDNRHRDQVLQYFRTSSRGSQILRGTTGQAGQSYGLQHLPWVAAVEVGLKREPDRNRFIMLELDKVDPERWGQLSEPQHAWASDIGQKLLAIAITHINEARELAIRLKEIRHEGIDGRVVESYAVPAAMLASFARRPDAGPFLLEMMLETVERADQGHQDEHDLISTILSAKVRCSRGQELTVSQILESQTRYHDHQEELEASGVGLVQNRRGPRTASVEGQDDTEFLFIAKSPTARNLLRGTTWERQSIEQILTRFPGALRRRRRLAGALQHGVLLPFAEIKAVFFNSDDEDDDAAPATVQFPTQEPPQEDLF